MSSTDATLYHVPPSFYSQIARVVMVEKGVPFRAVLTGAGPPTFETYRPWYMRLNPEGTVPTLVVGDRAVPDSLRIARYVDEHFDGPRLTPSDDTLRQQMDEWVDRLRAISFRELSYGGERQRSVGYAVNKRRLANLRSRLKKHPEMADVYRAKIEDIRGFAEVALNDDHIAKLRSQVATDLSELDEILKNRECIVGEQYTLADAHWTVGIARLKMLGQDPLAGREALARWYARMKARPSFVEADVWERFQPLALVGALAKKFWPQLVLFVGGLAGLGYLVARWLG